MNITTTSMKYECRDYDFMVIDGGMAGVYAAKTDALSATISSGRAIWKAAAF